MKSLQISFILLFSFLLISNETEPLYGKGLPRDSDQLIPSESSYPSWETGEYESINPQRMKDVVIDISNIALESKKRTPYWGRLPGTPEDKKTMDYIENKLTKLGFSIEKKDVYITKEWRPAEWSLSYKFDNRSHSIKSAFPTGENINHLDSNVNAELVWVGLGSEADFLNKDIKGKAVVIYSFFVPGGRSHSASNRAKLFNANEIASDKGAALIINIMGVPGDGQFAGGAFHGTSGKPASSFKAPIITISQDEGFLLRDRMLKGKIIDAIGRSLNPDSFPKWYKYGNSMSYYAYRGDGVDRNVAVVVEDVISAIAVGSYFPVIGFSLLGTALQQEHLYVLSNFDRVVVALDPDASKKSLEHAKELSNYVSDVKVLKLTDDLKYKNLEDFKKLEEILNG